MGPEFDFDELARDLARGLSRREALRRLGVGLDGKGNIYVVGSTTSANFPTTPGAFKRSFGGESDGFMAKIALAP